MLIFLRAMTPMLNRKGTARRYDFSSRTGLVKSSIVNTVINDVYRPDTDVTVSQYVSTGKFGNTNNGVAAVDVRLPMTKVSRFLPL